jgi:hypothetical protein
VVVLLLTAVSLVSAQTVSTLAPHSDAQTALSGLVSIALTPANPSVQAGNTEQFHATGTFTGGRTQDVTRLTTWTSSLTTVATISNVAGTQGLATAVAAGTTVIKANIGAIKGKSTSCFLHPAASTTRTS